MGLRKASLLVIGRGRLPRHAAGGLLGSRVLTVAGALWKYRYVPALSGASPTRMPLRGQREGACGGAWLARGRDLRRGNRGLLSAGSGGPVGAVFPVCFFLEPNFRVDHSLLCVGLPGWVQRAGIRRPG